MAVKKLKDATTGEPNTMRRIIKGYERHVGDLEIQLEAERQRADDLNVMLAAEKARASMYKDGWLELDDKLSSSAEIKALKEENARLKAEVKDIDALRGAVASLRRVIVEALQG